MDAIFAWVGDHLFITSWLTVLALKDVVRLVENSRAEKRAKELEKEETIRRLEDDVRILREKIQGDSGDANEA